MAGHRLFLCKHILCINAMHFGPMPLYDVTCALPNKKLNKQTLISISMPKTVCRTCDVCIT